MTNLSSLKTKALDAVAAADSTAALEQLRIDFLGKKGEITELLKQLGALQPEERKTFGAEVNALKQSVSEALDAKKATLSHQEMHAKLARETLDITLPVSIGGHGRIHPISYVMEEITTIFARMGFGIAQGPDIESQELNFSALNIPAHHPARQMHDTFYLKQNTGCFSSPTPLGGSLSFPTPLAGGDKGGGYSGNPGNGESPPPAPPASGVGAFNARPNGAGIKPETQLVLRTHTSPVQIRAMLANKPPMRFIAPGTTYRCDSDQTHTPMFHQVEGFVIDKNIHMGHLKGCLIQFLKEFFELDEVPVRFRPSYFPFTEPSCEVDIGCKRTKDSLEIGAGKDWLEVLGCGMIHPVVLKNGNINPDEYQGFAFGMGVERLAMLKYGIPDLRMFFESDLRWLRHYGFQALDNPSNRQGA